MAANDHWQPNTLNQRRYAVRKICESFGDLPIRDISEDHILALKLKLRGEEVSRSWESTIRAVLAQFFKWATITHCIDRNPYDCGLWKLRKKVIDTSKFRHYSHQEIDALLTRLDVPMQAYAMASCVLGWRKNTLLNMRWWWINEEWWAKAPAEYVKQGVELMGFIPPKARELLLPRRQPMDLVLDAMPSYCHINKILKKAAEEVGLEPDLMHPHQFRKTWCKWFRDAGGTREEAMLIQRWESDNILLDHYWPKVDEKRQMEIARKL